MIDTLLAKLAGASGLTWLKVLPWALLGVGALTGGAAAWGWHEGARVTGASYEAEKAHAGEISAEASRAMVEHVLQVSVAIAGAGRDAIADLARMRAQRPQRIKEVTADVKAHLSDDCRVPADTFGVRQRQVEESAAIRAADRPM